MSPAIVTASRTSCARPTAACRESFANICERSWRARRRYLARIDNDSIITGGLKRVDGFGGVGSKSRDDKELDAITILALALANDSSYQQTLERVSSKLDSADRAAEQALLEIDRLLAENARRREELIAQAYKREDGTALFLGEDDKTVRDEHGRELSAEEAANLPMDELRRGPRWEQMEGLDGAKDALQSEREEIERHNEKRLDLRNRIKEGNLSQKELEALESELERDMPGRMKRHSPEAANEELAQDTSFTLSDDELGLCQIKSA